MKIKHTQEDGPLMKVFYGIGVTSIVVGGLSLYAGEPAGLLFLGGGAASIWIGSKCKKTNHVRW